MQLTIERAEAFARMPLTYLRQEYPNHIMHLLNGPEDVLSPRAMHPVFYGCYDWHSAVHGYWLLLRCLRLYPGLPAADEITALFDEHFTPELMERETDYFRAPNRAPFERPYGFAWLLALDQELLVSAHPQARQWHTAMQPLTTEIRRRLLDYLSKLSYPIRVGAHFNTAFSLALSLDYAHHVQDSELESVIIDWSQRHYGADTDYPVQYEPGGDEFISGALTEALLMSKVMNAEAFPAWFDQYLPRVAEVAQLMQPAHVSDPTDPKVAHLDGLNLSRAWCMKQVLRHLSTQHPARAALEASAQRHIAASLDQVVGSHYSGGHWLATFAVLALED
ncbi:DUF2891 domain-containing protein [Herbaspirillum rubrisubalbicans]|uniref:DUF2891 domain-containing protein n=1 Tax=Herbaspirillum rubrisubalbicans TaxID=80842 RepID=A0AAD0U6A7_9BURK|nr:DUF2891 domain-containing protein [Herbaspirillum rubrisubalbicans]AYR23879.1 DUF2891 domain-containing protein [Herbaspirillum rubrisubalbicans]